MSEKIKILFILPSLRAGGAERIVSFIAQNLDDTKFKAELLVIGFEKDKAYSVKNVDAQFLNKKRVLIAIPKLFKQIFKKNPQIIMTSVEHLTAITAINSLWLKKTKFVSREANIKKITKIYHKTSMPLVSRLLYRYSYRLLDAIVCQSKDMAEELKELYPKTSKKIYTINNPITNLVTTEISVEKKIQPSYITVGRLHDEKGHIRILEALSRLKFSFSYTIIGSGPHEQKIRDKVDELKLNEKIHWIDFTNEIEKHLKDSSAFIQGSYAEGFPNALLESCVVGTPVIAYNCPGGTSEIVEHGVNGFLVDNEIELSESLIKLKDFPLQRQQVIESVVKKFNKERIISQYEDLFTKLVNN